MNCYHYVGNLYMVLAVVGTAEANAQDRNAARRYVHTHALTQLPAMCTCPQKLVRDIRRPSKIFYLFVNIYVHTVLVNIRVVESTSRKPYLL